MPEKSQKKMVQELYQAVVGLPENSNDNGLIGDISEVKTLVKTQNSRVRKNEQRIFKIWGILVGMGIAGGLGINSLLGR